ncbi:hypothetical protein ASD99_29525 [Mesorhizobium sp. Root695]|nr:hypothetical protein ASD99_29525 [Mesorhizobium sp. Root695]
MLFQPRLCLAAAIDAVRSFRDHAFETQPIDSRVELSTTADMVAKLDQFGEHGAALDQWQASKIVAVDME